MLHHISLGVENLVRSAEFYNATLLPLGYVCVCSDSTALGYGYPGGGDKLALKLRSNGLVVPGPGFNLAFAAPTREAVAQFHEAALSHGGRDYGAPGLRPDYGANYYAAFVIDPDGYHIEAVINVAVQPAS